MNILLIGSGGREHTLAWKMAQSDKLDKLFIAPGNAGTSSVGENVDISGNDFPALEDFSIKNNIDFIVVGPEEPLVKGIADYFKNSEKSNIPVVGPSMLGATLEGSKDFAKDFMSRHNIPTAAYGTYTKDTINDAFAFLETLKPPYVLKADGLAAGKGVLILDDIEVAKDELAQMFSGKFGSAGDKVVIEEFLDGIELSVFVLTDGESYVTLPSAKDYKRIGEGDKGPNTGGMGAISPVPFADSAFMAKVEERVTKPTINGFKTDNIDYKGFVFIGLMNIGGDPFVIEYNVRLGDPETEVVIPRIKGDLVELLSLTANKELSKATIELDDRTCATVMLVSGGYPNAYEKGKEISNINQVEDSIVFHAGTKDVDGTVETNGGRVIAVSSFGNSIREAVTKSFKAAELINFDGKNYRTDIGSDLYNYVE